MYPLSRRALAEFIGTLALIFVGAGSILSDRLAGGGVSLVGIALAHGLTIAVMASAFGQSPGDAVVYWISQLAGGVTGAALLTLVFDPATRLAANLGTPGLGPGVLVPQGLVFEIVATFFLVLVVCATAIDERGAFSVVSGLPIGFVITFDILAGGPVSGASMNPARSFGPALVGGFWAHHWIYWVGPLAGGALAGFLYSSLYLRRANPA